MKVMKYGLCCFLQEGLEGQEGSGTNGAVRNFSIPTKNRALCSGAAFEKNNSL